MVYRETLNEEGSGTIIQRDYMLFFFYYTRSTHVLVFYHSVVMFIHNAMVFTRQLVMFIHIVMVFTR